MLNEFAYCPRLAYLEWVDGDFADSADTIEGRHRHRRVDQPGGELADPGAQAETRLHARSLQLSAPRVGLVARIDLVESEGDHVTPVDYKRGKPPDIPERAWEPERVQLCAQALVLEENGYRVARGVLYFVEAKQRVEVLFDDALRARTLALLAEFRAAAGTGAAPPPLVDSPKCPRCSLVGICLPDEVNLLRGAEAPAPRPPRRLLPSDDDALPVYVQAAGARVGKKDELLVIEDREGGKQTVRLGQTSQLALFGGVQVSTQAVQELCGRGIPILYLSSGGWFYGLTNGMTHKNVELRRAQFRAADTPLVALAIARRMIAAKLRNSRTMLRRNAEHVDDTSLSRLKQLAADVEAATSAETLLGLEGTGARIYYDHLPSMLKDAALAARFEAEGRNRRPPRDPVNALLSFLYTLLAKELSVAALAVGFDPFLGFYHRPRYGRPALALDLMEEFRPIVADSVALSVLNNGIASAKDFLVRGPSCTLKPHARAKVLEAYERRLDEEVTHPIFGYRISYRRVFEVQTRLLARHVMGELEDYPAFQTR
jgi:CRISPR-associated protein Cas1